MIDIKIEKQYAKAITYCLSLCTHRRYTVIGMTEKVTKYLEKENLDEEIKISLIERIIDRLLDLKYLNDLQYAKDFISERTRLNPRGSFKISQELKKKKISYDIINSALSESEINETEIIESLLPKKANKWHNLPIIKQKEKAYRFLAGRGFASESIYNSVNNYYSNIKDKDT